MCSSKAPPQTTTSEADANIEAAIAEFQVIIVTFPGRRRRCFLGRRHRCRSLTLARFFSLIQSLIRTLRGTISSTTNTMPTLATIGF